jgi:multidrug efflux pump subunit AcrB
MLFWPGIMGEFMSYLPLTLIVTLSSSLFVAMVINPALASIFMKIKPRSWNGVAAENNQAKSAEEIARAGESPVHIKGPVLSIYVKSLQQALNHKIAFVLIAVCILVLLVQVWLLLIGLEKPVEFFPNIEPKAMYVNLDTPEGADLKYVDSVVRQVELAVNGYEASQETIPAEEQYKISYEPKEHKKKAAKDFSDRAI